MKNKMTIIISVVAVIVVAGALLLVFNPFNSSASAAESTPAVNASPDAAPTSAPAAAATDSTSAMLSAPASESNDEIIALFNNTFDTAHEDNRLPAEYDAWTDYEFVVMHDLVFKGEFNLDGIALQELDSAYLLWREENYAEAEDKLFERINGSMGSPYFVIDQSGSDVYDYFGDIDNLEIVDHIEYNKGVIVISKGLESTSADGWVKAHIYIWDADVNKSVLVTVYVEAKNIRTEKGPAIEVKEEQSIVEKVQQVPVVDQLEQIPAQDPIPVTPDAPEQQPTNSDGAYDNEGNFHPGAHRDENGTLWDWRGNPIPEDTGVRSGDLQDGDAGLDHSGIIGA